MAKEQKSITWLEYTGSIGNRKYELSTDALTEATRMLKPIGAFADLACRVGLRSPDDRHPVSV